MTLLRVLIVGIVLGLIDIIPMLKKQLDKHAIMSAFMYHLIMPFVLLNISSGPSKILTGAILYFICAVPIVILNAKDDKKSIPIIFCSSIVLGTICSWLFQVLL
jgi:hypothetical protein